jgi:peptidoglycan/xylan/chitin deacetylase (PgdA/CDA1 family)
VIRLSFDDGPSEWTPVILDLLFAADVQAWFFVVGASIEGRENVLRRQADEGHRIGVHGWNHVRLPPLPAIEISSELSATARRIEAVVGIWPEFYRAPYLESGEYVDAIASKLGMSHFGADCTPDDWTGQDPEAVAAICLGAYAENPDAMICLHDGVPPHGGSARCTASRASTVEAVRLILEALA